MAVDRYLGTFLLMVFACCGGSGSDEMEELVVSMELGQEVYEKYCLACHQKDGSGVPGLYPPLAQTEWVSGDKDRLIEVILLGLSGAIDIDGEIYDQEMASNEFLSDEEISAVLTYVRSGFGNDSDEITAGEVASVRARLKPNDQ